MRKNLNKIKQLLFLFATLLFIGCNEETHEHEETSIPSNIKRKKVNFKKFSENKDAFAVFKKLKTMVSKSENNSKAVSLDSLDFEVNFNNGLHLSYANLESYTFPIRRTLPNGLLENLVINEHTDGKYYAKLLKYNLTPQEILDLENSNLKSIQNPIQTQILGELNFGNSIQSDCGQQTITIIIPCVNGHTSSSQCDLTGASAPRILTLTIAIDCNGGGFYGGGGGTGDGTGGYYGNPFTTGGGGGSFTPSFPNDATPTDLYDNGISEPVLDIGYQNKPIDTFFGSLNAQQQQWVYEQSTETQQSIINYLTENSFSDESESFIQNLIDYLLQNPNVSWNEISESFFSLYPETESVIDINPDNITYDTPLTSQNLPSLASFTNNFPKNGTNGNYTQMSASEVYSLAGGSLLNSYNNNPNAYANACSIRGSRGLLYSNIQIPVLNYNGSQRTQKGSDLKNYILDAKSFNKFMIDKFGETANKLEDTAANNPQQVLDFLAGKNGIYVIINKDPGKAGYTGHVDLIINGNCIGNEYLQPVGGIKSVRIWSLN